MMENGEVLLEVVRMANNPLTVQQCEMAEIAVNNTSGVPIGTKNLLLYATSANKSLLAIESPRESYRAVT